MKKEGCKGVNKGKRIFPEAISGKESVANLVDNYFDCYNSGRLREACELLSKKVFGHQDVTVGVSLSGALTPAGLGVHSIVPLMKAGFIDWISSTGANLYHDTHYALDFSLHRGGVHHDDVALKENGVVRIYDILFDYDVLLNTDAFYVNIFSQPEFNGRMTTTEMHFRIGKYVAEREKALGLDDVSILATAYKNEIPIFAPAPGDSSIGMNAAEKFLGERGDLILDVFGDVNESAAIVLEAKKSGGKSAVLILGGGVPKNFMLQTEPQIQEVLGIKEKGHDYFVQITDARADTGGLSGATPSEAVTWGKVDEEMLPDTVVCYTDTTIALPIIASYCLGKTPRREQKRLYSRRAELLAKLRSEYLAAKEERMNTLFPDEETSG